MAKKTKTDVLSIVGKKDGYAYKNSNVSLCIPIIDNKLVTPFSEGFQAVVWHCIVSDPRLKKNNTKW